MLSVRYFCTMLTKFGFFLTGFYKSPQCKISRKSVEWEKALIYADGLTDTQTDGRDKVDRRLLRLWKHA